MWTIFLWGLLLGFLEGACAWMIEELYLRRAQG